MLPPSGGSIHFVGRPQTKNQKLSKNTKNWNHQCSGNVCAPMWPQSGCRTPGRTRVAIVQRSAARARLRSVRSSIPDGASFCAPVLPHVAPLCCPNVAPMWPQCCPNVAPMLPQCCPDVAPMWPPCCPNVAPMLPQCCHNVAPRWPQYCPNVAPMLPQCCPNVAPMLPQCGPNVAPMLAQCGRPNFHCIDNFVFVWGIFRDPPGANLVG